MERVVFLTASMTGRPNPNIVKQILDDNELIEMMKEVLIQEGRICPFCRRKLKEKSKVKEIS